MRPVAYQCARHRVCTSFAERRRGSLSFSLSLSLLLSLPFSLSFFLSLFLLFLIFFLLGPACSPSLFLPRVHTDYETRERRRISGRKLRYLGLKSILTPYDARPRFMVDSQSSSSLSLSSSRYFFLVETFKRDLPHQETRFSDSSYWYYSNDTRR